MNEANPTAATVHGQCGSKTMNCERCHGLMVKDHVGDLNLTIQMLRCVNCGAQKDIAVIQRPIDWARPVWTEPKP